MTRRSNLRSRKSGPSRLVGQIAFALVLGLASGAMFGMFNVLLGADQRGPNLAFLLVVSAVWGSALGVGVGALSGLLAKISQLPPWQSTRQRRVAYSIAASFGSAPVWLLYFLNTPSQELKSALPFAALSIVVAVVAWFVFPKFERHQSLSLL